MTQLKLLTVAVSAALLGACTVAPLPLKDETVAETASQDSSAIYDAQQPISGSVGLYQAMARALKYNLQHRVSRMEQALASRNFDLVRLDMLPALNASGGLSARTNRLISSSESVITNTPSVEPSVSTDKSLQYANLGVVWNVLDFGVSYVQAQQEADRILISQLAREKTMRSLLQQTRSAFWRAAALQQVGGEIDALIARAEASRKELMQVRKENLRSPLTTLRDLRTLSELLIELESMRKAVASARIELASLINVPPGTAIRLDLPSEAVATPMLNKDMAELERLALANSADYRSEMYNARIEQQETRKAMLRMLPGIEFSYATNYDSNSYLVNQAWGEAGLRVSWNLMRLLSYEQQTAHNEAREQVALARRQAANMAVMAKLHLSWQEYHNALAHHGKTAQLSGYDQEIAKLTGKARSAQAASGTQQIQQDARALRSEMRRLLAYADVQQAYGGLLFSLGIDPIPEGHDDLSLDDLAASLQQGYQSLAQLPAEALVQRTAESE